MNKIIELAREAGMSLENYGGTLLVRHLPSDSLERFYTLTRADLEAENAKLKHNIGVLTDALWKSCGDDEDTVNATIESQGVLK